jgi:hypothetical protein
VAFNLIKCWNINSSVLEVDAIIKKEHDINLVKKSILKNGYRAFFLNTREEVETSSWYHHYLQGDKIKFYIDGSGVYKLANIDLTEKELYFEKSNLPSGYKPWIFSSWQSDYNPSRGHINQALSEAITSINSSRKPRRPLELVESIRPEDGAKDIVSAIKQNIDKSLIAVFDITNVAKVMNINEEPNVDKYYPNANVIFEVSYALQRKSENQIILVKRKRDDINNDLVPFDFQQHRHIPYKQVKELKRELTSIISNTLEKMGSIV